MRYDGDTIHSVNDSRAGGRVGFALTALALLTGIVLLISLAGSSYAAVLRSEKETDALRGTLGYIRTQVKSHDYAGGVSLRDGMLVLSESDGERQYELRIYAHEGYLMEEYCAAGEESSTERASRLAETERFLVRRESGDLLRVETDGGESYIRLFAAALAEDAA